MAPRCIRLAVGHRERGRLGLRLGLGLELTQRPSNELGNPNPNPLFKRKYNP